MKILCVVSLTLAALLSRVTAQFEPYSTNVTCTTATWTNNSLNQSPCLVGAALWQECVGGRVNIPPLPPGDTGKTYTGPEPGQSDPCYCSSVTYSMFSACALCQGGSIINWSNWKINCPSNDTSVASFPLPIPANIAIPSWAYMNVNLTDIFDATAALANHTTNTTLDSTAAPGPTSPSASSATPHKKSNAGAIAGGVIGGLAFVVIVTIAAIWIMRKRQARIDAKFHEAAHTAPTAYDYSGGQKQVEVIIRPPELPAKFYDPNDPTTFPPSPGLTLPAYASPTATATSLPDHLDPRNHARNLSGGDSHITSFGPISTRYGRDSPATSNPPAIGYTGVPEI